MRPPWSSDEPARQTDYRRLYVTFKNRLDSLEDSLVFISREMKELRKQIEVLKPHAKSDGA